MAKSKQEQAEKAREHDANAQDETPKLHQEEQAEEEQEEEEPERLNHWEAAHRVVKQIDGDTTLSELAHDADKLVVAGGGNSNETRAWNNIWSVLQSLQELGMVELTEEVSVHPLHPLPKDNGQK